MLAAMVPIIQLLLLLVLLQFMIKRAESDHRISLPGCPDNCGGVSIPYPFGIGRDCFMEGFEVFCNAEDGGVVLTPFVTSVKNIGRMNLLNVSLSLGQARMSVPISSQCYNDTTKVNDVDYWFLNGSGTPFMLNHKKNKFTVVGCNNLAYIQLANDEYSYMGGCVSACGSLESLIDGEPCSGVGCCQTAVPKGINSVQFWFDDRFNSSAVKNFSSCGYATVMEDAAFTFKTSYITTNELFEQAMPAVIDWAIGGSTSCETAQMNKSSYACRSDYSICLNLDSGRGYLCNCSEGYRGNPYLEGGCQDVDECGDRNQCFKPGKCHNFPGGYRCSCPFGWKVKHNNKRECELDLTPILGTSSGIAAVLFLGFGIYVFLEKRYICKVKEKYFQEYGGWILLEEIKSNQGFGFVIFTKQQVEQATNNFDSANIIGHGGQGTVYKGILKDQAVAIKKCKITNESKKKEFGKEMLILSQINHKNIVNLLGCCLEVEVPMLVYEFIPNGTLHDHIHRKRSVSHIPLVIRLRIAHEAAEALAYLHTSASPPIFHGDVKSANILLNQNFTVKVSDFGASMLAPTNEAQCVTLVQGTWGYLDPEYIQTCKLTDKSDVYSFGVVLLELLTGKPVIDFGASEEERSLSSRFLSAMKENKLHELVDDEIKSDAADMQSIEEIAELAKNCLSMKGVERPMMKEVAEELHRIGKIKQHSCGQQHNPEETKSLLSERFHHEIGIEHSGDSVNLDKDAVESIALGR